MSEERTPLTFDKVSEEENKRQHEEGHKDKFQYSVEGASLDNLVSLQEMYGDVADILTTSPSRFVEGFNKVGLPQKRQENINQFGALIEVLQNQFGELSGDLSSLDQKGLLLDIARSNRLFLQFMSTLLQTNVEMLSAQYDTLSAVEPFSQIVVSGLNTIENENEVAPVVPESDTVEIPSRTVFIKASPKNDGVIALGDDEVSPQDGWILRKGEYIVIDDDLGAEEIYMSGNEAGDSVELLGVR